MTNHGALARLFIDGESQCTANPTTRRSTNTHVFSCFDCNLLTPIHYLPDPCGDCLITFALRHDRAESLHFEACLAQCPVTLLTLPALLSSRMLRTVRGETSSSFFEFSALPLHVAATDIDHGTARALRHVLTLLPVSLLVGRQDF